MPPDIHQADAKDIRNVPAERHGESRISTDSSASTGRFLALAVFALAIFLAIGFAVAYGIHKHTESAAVDLAQASADAKPVVDVVPVRPTAHTYPLELPGQTAGWYQSTIFARVDGYVGNWWSDIGDHVKQGQVLAVIDTPELDQQLNAARAKVVASEAQVNVAESSVSIAKLTYERWRDSPKGVVSEQERDETKAAYEQAVARLAAAKAQAQLDQADVDRYNALEQFKKVTAPYDGIITARKVDIGDLVSAGSSSNTSSLYSIAQSTVIRVFVDVPQKAAADMVVGLSADITSDQYPDRTFRGKVARSAMSVDPQTRTQRTEVDIPNPDLALVPGMYVQVIFQLNQRGLLEVPAAAIMSRPDGLQVAVVDSDDKVDFRPITVAKDNGDTVILASGVNPGDRVALNLNSAVMPNEQVTVEDGKNTPASASASVQPAPTEEPTDPSDAASPDNHPSPPAPTATTAPLTDSLDRSAVSQR